MTAPRLSRRIETLTPGRDGWELFRRARARVAAGDPVIELTIGEHDDPTDPAILDAMDAAARAGATGYSAGAGIPPLREAIARRAERLTGVPTAPANVAVTAGGQAGLLAALAATCDPGDTALYIDPFYATYPGTIRAVGAVARAVPARADLDFQPDPADLAAAAALPGVRAVLVNTPNNPTGVVYGEDTLAGLARVARDAGLWVISDEVYDGQVWDGRHLSPRALPGIAERTLVVGSLSKSHAMTGSRLGWIVGPEPAVARIVNLSTHTTYGIPGFIQHAGVAALAMGPGFEARIAAPFRRRHAAVARQLAGRPGLAVVPSRATMYLMLDIRATGLSGIAFAERLLDEADVAVMPGESFGQAAAGHVRLALTRPDGQLAEAVERLATLAARLAREDRAPQPLSGTRSDASP